MNEERVICYRPNDVLSFISIQPYVTFYDLQQFLNHNEELDTVSVFYDLLHGGMIETGDTVKRGSSFYTTFKLTPYGREKMKEDLGVIEYKTSPAVEAPEVVLRALDRQGHLRMEGLSDEERLKLFEQDLSDAKEAYTQKESPTVEEQIDRFFGKGPTSR